MTYPNRVPRGAPTSDAQIKAVQYLRMSREHQRYSLANQRDAIASYAATRGIEIVQTYEDSGRSGLSLKGRPGLQRLLSDALQPDADFTTILVLDVSRWGRFQDTDQAAYYEFICRQAGVEVRYCAEQFENDGSGLSSIIKSLKRVMAAEFSRELGEKVLVGQMRGARLGYKQGGMAPYGLRRKVIDERGQVRVVLEQGQRKSVQTDRVVYVHGPDEELETIRLIFDLYGRKRLGHREIARRLAADGRSGKGGKPWTWTGVRNVLISEVYCGDYIYNKTTQRMRAGVFLNSPEHWVRIPMFEPIIDPGLFQAAVRRRAKTKVRRYTNDALLDHLRRVEAEAGKLDYVVIAKAGPPTIATYIKRFGSIENAYTLIGYQRPSYPNWRSVSDDALLDGLRRLLEARGYLSVRLIETDPALPSCQTYCRRFGSLFEAYRLAGWSVANETEARLGASARRRLRFQGAYRTAPCAERFFAEGPARRY